MFGSGKELLIDICSKEREIDQSDEIAMLYIIPISLPKILFTFYPYINILALYTNHTESRLKNGELSRVDLGQSNYRHLS